MDIFVAEKREWSFLILLARFGLERNCGSSKEDGTLHIEGELKQAGEGIAQVESGSSVERSGLWKCEKCGYLKPDNEVIVGVPDVELGVIVYGDGQASNRWEDGVVGVPGHIREAANQEVDGLCAECHSPVVWESGATFEKFLTDMGIKIASVVTDGCEIEVCGNGNPIAVYLFNVTLERVVNGDRRTMEIVWHMGEGLVERGSAITIDEVMSCLTSESSMADCNLDEFCSELGLSPLEGIKEYKAMHKQQKRLKAFLGEDYDKVMKCEL